MTPRTILRQQMRHRRHPQKQLTSKSRPKRGNVHRTRIRQSPDQRKRPAASKGDESAEVVGHERRMLPLFPAVFDGHVSYDEIDHEPRDKGHGFGW